MSPYNDPHVTPGEIADYLHSQSQQSIMFRFTQRFCKLFDYGQEGQLLVLCLESKDDKPSLSISTVSPEGVTMTVTSACKDEETRDKAFLDFKESQALVQFRSMQKALAEAAA